MLTISMPRPSQFDSYPFTGMFPLRSSLAVDWNQNLSAAPVMYHQCQTGMNRQEPTLLIVLRCRPNNYIDQFRPRAFSYTSGKDQEYLFRQCLGNAV